MNQEQKKEAKKLPGFYIALCCCVLVIGVAGYFTERNTNKTSSVINTEVVNEEPTESPVFTTDTGKYAAVIPTAQPVFSPTPAPAAAYAEPDAVSDIPVTAPAQETVEDYAADNPDVEETAIIVSSEQPAFIMPVTGEILEGYSDKLVYNSALADWRTHNGIDIAAEKGCSVQSVSDGVVDEVSEDVSGVCVTISHAAGFVTKYMGLENAEDISEGVEVKSGEVIGTVGDGKGENVTEPHLHFEMTKDGEILNPSDYLPHE